jgi:DNA mismatch repair protein MutS
MGSRLLRHWLTHPPRERHRAPSATPAIGALQHPGLRPAARRAAPVSDVERITARTALRQVRPRELAGLRARRWLGCRRCATVARAGAPLLDELHTRCTAAPWHRAAAAPSPTSPRCCCATAA